jgi:hypothetical protein
MPHAEAGTPDVPACWALERCACSVGMPAWRVRFCSELHVCSETIPRAGYNLKPSLQMCNTTLAMLCASMCTFAYHASTVTWRDARCHDVGQLALLPVGARRQSGVLCLVWGNDSPLYAHMQQPCRPTCSNLADPHAATLQTHPHAATLQTHMQQPCRPTCSKLAESMQTLVAAGRGPAGGIRGRAGPLRRGAAQRRAAPPAGAARRHLAVAAELAPQPPAPRGALRGPPVCGCGARGPPDRRMRAAGCAADRAAFAMHAELLCEQYARFVIMFKTWVDAWCALFPSMT